MFLLAIVATAAAVFSTSLISGIFGMAGGLMLLWLLLLVYPAATAIALQGLIQGVANVSRAWFSREFVEWRIAGLAIAGMLTAAAFLAIVAYTPDRATVYIAVGLLPILVWIPKRWFQLDGSRPPQAFLCGFLGGALNIAVGVAGPTIDVFFIRTALDRRAVIATKSVLQVCSHSVKFIFYFASVMALGPADWTAVAIAAPFAVLGTSAGHWVLTRMSDDGFRYWVRWIVTAIGAVYLVQGIMVLAGG